jgi:hypothetical protein
MNEDLNYIYIQLKQMSKDLLKLYNTTLNSLYKLNKCIAKFKGIYRQMKDDDSDEEPDVNVKQSFVSLDDLISN